MNCFRMNKLLVGAASALLLVVVVIHQHGADNSRAVHGSSSLRVQNRSARDERMLPLFGGRPTKLKMYWEKGYDWQVRTESSKDL